MATFLYKTKGNANPKGKPRVYFTSHPEDFDRYLDKLCEDVFKTHDCAIYYTESMTEAIDEHDMDADLGQMNLFVVPVTFRLLSQPNRAMDVDLAYAKQQNIAILPFMMESGIDAFYSAPEKFGQRQYINPYSTDTTEISYADKLKKYLEAVLISDETAQRVRDAFDAYIFLSYRKKDRRYANQLMRLIHKNPEYRDIAIWYDEFLTPGESFKQNIDKAMQQSKLFTLLVTPSLLEYVDGKPNFVMGVEYPAAKSAGMGVLPAEMVETDKAELREKYADIPDCVTAQDEPALRQRLLDALDQIAKSENNNDPEHNFLIGLAYLDGIDVEVDRDRALELITSAAESGLLDAMKKLCEMYQDGKGVQVNTQEAIKWAERIVEYCEKHFGKEHPYTLLALINLQLIHREYREYEDPICKNLEKRIDTIKNKINWDDVSIEILEKTEAVTDEIITKNDYDIDILKMNCEALNCGIAGNFDQAIELQLEAYTLSCNTFGEEHPKTIDALYRLTFCYYSIGDYQKEAALEEKCYTLRCKVLGEEHPDTLQTLHDLAITYSRLGEHRKALELHKRTYDLRCKVLGESHQDTLSSLYHLAYTYGDLGDHPKALELDEKAYALQCSTLGKLHLDTLRTLNDIAWTHDQLGNHQQAIELQEQLYAQKCKVLGKKDPSTVKSWNKLQEYRQKAQESDSQPKKKTGLKDKIKSLFKHK